MSTKRTAQEIADLKASWLRDPCWDIETTEGFEAHANELLAYRVMMEDKWQAEADARMDVKAEELGVPVNRKLAGYVMMLEKKLEALRESTDRQHCYLDDKIIELQGDLDAASMGREAA